MKSFDELFQETVGRPLGEPKPERPKVKVRKRARRGPPPERDRQAIRDGLARSALIEKVAAAVRTETMPAICGTCGGRMRIDLTPPIRRVNEHGGPHRCEVTPENAARLAAAKEVCGR